MQTANNHCIPQIMLIMGLIICLKIIRDNSNKRFIHNNQHQRIKQIMQFKHNNNNQNGKQQMMTSAVLMAPPQNGKDKSQMRIKSHKRETID